MSNQTKAIPSFSNEAEERAYWETHDSTLHLDETKAKQVVPMLYPLASCGILVLRTDDQCVLKIGTPAVVAALASAASSVAIGSPVRRAISKYAAS